MSDEHVDNQSLVSIIIPTYNRAELLRESVDSALNQTYTNIEVVVVDDGSQDDTHEIMEGYGDRIRTVYLGYNSGVSHALNVGMEHATGQWFKFHGSDDILDCDAIAKIMSQACAIDASEGVEKGVEKGEKNPNSVCLLLCAHRIISASGDVIEYPPIMHEFNSFSHQQKILAIVAGYVPIGSFVCHRDALGGRQFTEKLTNWEDYDLLMRCILDGSPVWCVNTRIFSVRRHNNSLSQQRNRPMDKIKITRAALSVLPWRKRVWYARNMTQSTILGQKIRKYMRVFNIISYMFPGPISPWLAQFYIRIAFSYSAWRSSKKRD